MPPYDSDITNKAFCRAHRFSGAKAQRRKQLNGIIDPFNWKGMNISPSKGKHAEKIRRALVTQRLFLPKSEEGPSRWFPPLQQEVAVEFGERFTKLRAALCFVLTSRELAFQLTSLVKKQDWQKVYCVEGKTDCRSFSGPVGRPAGDDRSGRLRCVHYRFANSW